VAAIPLSAIGSAYVTLAPPWSYRLFKLGRLAWGKGVTPPHLAKYQATGMNENLRKAQARVKAFSTGKSRGRRR